MYLIVSDVGYYLGFSRAAVEARCKVLRSGPSNVIECIDIKEAKRHIALHIHKRSVRNIEFEKLVYWPGKICLINLKAGISYLCFGDGIVWAHTRNGKNVRYKICQNYSLDTKKSVKLLEKWGEFWFYNFEEKKAMKITVEGEVYIQTEESIVWEKVSRHKKVSKP